MSSAPVRGLVADLGGTNARFAVAEIAESGQIRITDMVRLKASHYPTAKEAISAYLDQCAVRDMQFVSIACAGPVRDGHVALTNLGWSLSTEKLHPRLDAGPAHLLNDLAAVAWAAPTLAKDDLRALGDGEASIGGDVIAVLGVGTGANCAAFLDGGGGGQVVVGEGGHISFSPSDDIDVEIWRRLAARFGRVSIERLASGPGLFNLYLALCDIEGQAQVHQTAEAVSAAADDGEALAGRTIDRFCRVLGSVAGDFALTFGAAAVYIAGGIAPGLMTTPARTQAFRDQFEDKGRFRGYLERVGSFVIVHPHAALLGAARAATLERTTV